MKGHKANEKKANIQKKIKKVQEVDEEIKKYSSMVLVELKNLPDVLFQTSRKRIREDGGKVVVAQKAIFQRVFEKNPKLKKFLEMIREPVALVLSNDSPTKLNSFFKNNKKKMAAKAGQIAPYEIVVPAGDTDLPPGPALSELKAAGVAVQIKAGKIAVNKDSVIAKEGEEITMKKSKALQMLGIMPFEKYMNILVAYDGEFVYESALLSIDENYAKNGISFALNQGMNVSLNSNYPTSITAETLITNAFMQGKNLALNGMLYSEGSVEQLLTLAFRQGVVLSDKTENK
ncbi:MAG: 50S ribosomal protein L10 [Candidatus ainarchaeum sp.]|nr:50S ribosomal protein L10 [Candidatus ainarchaeum sp.]